MTAQVSWIDQSRLIEQPELLDTADLTPAVRAYLGALVRQGVSNFLTNAEGCEAAILRVNSKCLPVIIASRRSGYAAWKRASMLSPYGHHLLYPIHEISRRSAFWTSNRLHMALAPLDLLLRLGGIDRVVFINHWLLNAQPRLLLDRDEVAMVTDELISRFPDAALVVQSVVPRLGRGDSEVLQACGFRPLRSRVIHLLDPRSGHHKQRSNVKRGKKLHARAHNDAVSGARELICRAGKIAQLYRNLYIDKHAYLNPDYAESFFRLALSSGLFAGRMWRAAGGEDEPYAFNLRLFDGDTICWSIGGYDSMASRRAGLYLLLMADDVVEAETNNIVLNWGGGAGEFKKLRGAQPVDEYDMIFYHHLPKWRRVPWIALRLARTVKDLLVARP